MTLFHGVDGDSNFQGKILVVIYTNLPDNRQDCDVGLPGTIVAYKIRTFLGGELGRKYIDFIFDTPAELQANTKYWVGFSKYGGSFHIPFHSDYSQDNRLAVHSDTGFFKGKHLIYLLKVLHQQNSNYVFWFRLYNPNAAVGKGEKVTQDHKDHQEQMESMEKMEHQEHLEKMDHQDHQDLQDKMEHQEHQEQMEKMEHQDHQVLQVKMEHQEQMEKMD